jgi:hypothetical protein
MGMGYYEDEYARVGGEWRFRSRKVTMYHLMPLSVGWAEWAAQKGSGAMRSVPRVVSAVRGNASPERS